LQFIFHFDLPKEIQQFKIAFFPCEYPLRQHSAENLNPNDDRLWPKLQLNIVWYQFDTPREQASHTFPDSDPMKLDENIVFYGQTLIHPN
jgi:hypothetical protein